MSETKDWSVSKKIDGKNVILFGVREGWKFSITPTGKRELMAYLKGNDEYFNGIFKVWDKKPEPTAHDQAKQDGYQPTPVEEDSIPF